MVQKPDLVLGFTDTFENCKLFFTDILSRRYNVIRDDKEPIYLIFGDSNFGQNHFNYTDARITKIFYTGENVRPSYFKHHKAITFDHVNSMDHYRLPLYVLEMWATMKDDNIVNSFDYLTTVHQKMDWEMIYDGLETGFTYIQSNPNCQPRNYFVQELMRNFNVKCGGPHLNNIGYVVPRTRPEKIQFLRSMRCNVAFENGAYPGYVTEKILDAFYAGVLPVYWGSSKIARDFNPKCFYHVKNEMDFGSAPGEIRTIMNDKKLWCDMMAAPRFNDYALNDYAQIDNFLDWFDDNVYFG